jgi:hypothetical protein
VPAVLMLYCGGRLIHFIADWNFRLISGIGLIYRHALNHRGNPQIRVPEYSVRPEFRGQSMTAAALIRAATDAVVARGYTNLVIDIF